MHATSPGRSWNYCLQTTLYGLRCTIYSLRSTVYGVRGTSIVYSLQSAGNCSLLAVCGYWTAARNVWKWNATRAAQSTSLSADCRKMGGMCVWNELKLVRTGEWVEAIGVFGAGGMGAEAGMVLHTASGGDICNWVGSKAKFSTRGRLECSNKHSCRNSWGLWMLIQYIICTCVGITTDYASMVNLEINK